MLYNFRTFIAEYQPVTVSYAKTKKPEWGVLLLLVRASCFRLSRSSREYSGQAARHLASPEVADLRFSYLQHLSYLLFFIGSSFYTYLLISRQQTCR